MRQILISIILFLFVTCIISINSFAQSSKNDSLLVKSIYGSGEIWTNYFKTSSTPLGARIRLNIINDSLYLIQWGTDSSKLNTYSKRFYLDGHQSRIPHFIDENKDYIVMRLGCGSPCWVGYFLPKKDCLGLFEAHEYLGYDLDNYLVAYLKATNIIEVYNLKTRKSEDHFVKGCVSGFLGYCIDSLKIENNYLTYKCFPSSKFKLQKGVIIKEKIKI